MGKSFIAAFDDNGPNNSGHHALLRWLRARGIGVDVAYDRARWLTLQDDWLASHSVQAMPRGLNVHNVFADHGLPEYRAIQGAFTGQQLLAGLWGSASSGWLLAELDRSDDGLFLSPAIAARILSSLRLNKPTEPVSALAPFMFDSPCFMTWLQKPVCTMRPTESCHYIAMGC